MLPARLILPIILGVVFAVPALSQNPRTREPKGDGIANDTAALQSLVDRHRGDLKLPSGTYRITRPIKIDLTKADATFVRGDGRVRILMDGPGPAFDLIGTHDGTAAPKTVKASVWDRQNAPVIANLEIVGSHPESEGVRLAGTLQPILRDLTIRKTRHAIHLVSRNRNVIVRDCHLYENSGIGLYFDDVNLHQTNVTGSHISYNAGGGIVIRGGNVRNVHITGCDIEGNMGGEDAAPTANVLLVSGSGSIGEVAITGCTIQHAHEANDSANIRVDLRSAAVSVTEELRHGNVTITGNVLSDTQVNVHLMNTRGATIAGNTIWKGYRANLLLENCEAVTITGNSMDRNPRYHYGDGDQARLGMRLADCRHCTVASNILNGVGTRDGAIELQRCEAINVIGCTISRFPSAGILVDQSSDCRITGCVLDAAGNHPTTPEEIVNVTDSDGILVRDNTIRITPAALPAAER